METLHFCRIPQKLLQIIKHNRSMNGTCTKHDFCVDLLNKYQREKSQLQRPIRLKTH